jgi:hypothetical protein
MYPYDGLNLNQTPKRARLLSPIFPESNFICFLSLVVVELYLFAKFLGGCVLDCFFGLLCDLGFVGLLVIVEIKELLIVE